MHPDNQSLLKKIWTTRALGISNYSDWSNFRYLTHKLDVIKATDLNEIHADYKNRLWVSIRFYSISSKLFIIFLFLRVMQL